MDSSYPSPDRKSPSPGTRLGTATPTVDRPPLGPAEMLVVLQDGPVDFPEHLRATRAPRDAEKVKVPHRGGHEHFERTTELIEQDGTSAVVFRWTTRTRVAE